MTRMLSILDGFLNPKMLSISYGNGVWLAALITRRKDDLKIVSELSGLEEITTFLSDESEIPILVNICDQGVLWTLVDESLNETNAIESFKEEVPNASTEDFVISFQENVLAFARKSLVDQILMPLDEFKERIVQLFLSPASAITLVHLSAKNESDVCVGAFSYSVNDGSIASISEGTSEIVNIEAETYKPDQALHLGVAIDYTMAGLGIIGMTDISINREMSVYDAFLKKAKMPALFFLLALFLINGLLFFRFSGMNSELKEKSGTLQLLNGKLTTLEGYILQNQSAYELARQNPKFSVIADRIGSITPSQIKLTKLIISPEKEGPGKRGVYEADVIVIEGLSNSGAEFSRWVDELENASWIQVLEKQKYEAVGKGKWDGTFQLIIKLNVEET